MALNIQCATLTQGASGVGGVQTIELGDNFNPVCGIVLAATVAADGIAANASMSIGFFSYRGGVAQQGCTSWISRDNVGTASSKQRQRMTECAVLMTNATGTTVDYQVSFTGLTTGVGSDITFDITNGHTTAGVRAFIMVFGGSDVLDAEAHTFTLVSPTGAQDVPLGSGFGHPQCVFFVADAWANSASVNSHATPSFGFGVLNGGDRCWSWCSQEAVTTQATSQGIGNTAALTLTDPGFGIENAFSLAAEAGFPTDGYEISKSTVTDGEDVIALAIRFSGNVTITDGESSMNTTVSTTNHAVGTSTPRGFLALHTRQTSANTADGTSANAALAGVGFMDQSGGERWCGMWDDDAQATASVASSGQSTTKVMRNYLPSTDALDSEADASISGSNVVVSWTDAAPSAFLYEWIAFGETAAAPTVAPNIAMAPYAGAF